MKKPLVIYHKDCPDGFGGAWAAWKKFGARAEYVPALPRILPNADLTDRDIYIVDNSFPVGTLRELREKNTKVVVLDHHESAEADVIAFPENVFDNSHSGSVLAWNYFHPKKPVPLMLKYVEDRDLWKFKMPHARSITKWMDAGPFSFERWSTMARRIENAKSRKECIREGDVIGEFFDRIVEHAVTIADEVKFGSHRVLATNVSLKQFTSEVGNRLAVQKPPFAIVWHVAGGMLFVSLRSAGEVNVAKIAEKHGGGGHKGAAAFKVPFKGDFPWKFIKK